MPKLERNRKRDQRNREELEGLGWHVEVVWACEIGAKRLQELADSISARGPGGPGG